MADLFFAFFHLFGDVVLHAVAVFEKEAIDEADLLRGLSVGLDLLQHFLTVLYSELIEFSIVHFT